MAFTLSGDDACQIVSPSPIPNPYWVAFSSSAAKLIGIELDANGLPLDPAWLDVCAGNSLTLATHHFSQPLSTVYSGHQFGVWAGQLGDGRAILLGEMEGQELQLKGAGKTRYSRMGDGRAVLRSSIREFLCSDAMFSLGIPTTRALSVVGSEMPIRRETLETAAVCTRIAPSFLRIGHFEHFASLQNTARLEQLANLLIQEHYPECQIEADPYLNLFRQICGRNASLVAQWQAVGFCHGVLNSDNISAIGITIDYGPFGFMDEFQIGHICNHTDRNGRYAYHRQPQIMHWNMACLASAFLPLLELTHEPNKAQSLLRDALEDFPVVFADSWQTLFRQKLGFITSQDGDSHLIERLLQAMHDSKVDFTNFFRQLSYVRQTDAAQGISLRDHFIDRAAIDKWFSDYINRLISEGSDDIERQKAMNRVNPRYILRNHLAQIAIDKAKQQDFSEISTLLKILAKPYDEQSKYEAYAKPPPPDLEKIEVSCSS